MHITKFLRNLRNQKTLHKSGFDVALKYGNMGKYFVIQTFYGYMLCNLNTECVCLAW
jgi:hypothetical protein